MTDGTALAAWFAGQLRASGEGFVWAVEQVPPARQTVIPLAAFGEWSVARLVYHMAQYERHLALPSMHQWLGGGLPTAEQRWAFRDEGLRFDPDWPVGDLLADFRAVREEQIALLDRLPAVAWDERRLTLWGELPLRWVVGKTWQHTVEHTNTVMQIALFWDAVERSL